MRPTQSAGRRARPRRPSSAPACVTGAPAAGRRAARAGRQQPARDGRGFDLAGFDAFDVHMSDLVSGRHRLEDFQVLVACGGFSYGDVLGAGVGWAKSVLFNARLAEAFSLLLPSARHACRWASAMAAR